MNTDRELMQQALEAWKALERLTGARWALETNYAGHLEAITALRERLAQPVQCRQDGRCQYAIDHGAEGIGACPPGKCLMPSLSQPTAQEVQNAAENLALMKRMFPEPVQEPVCDKDPQGCWNVRCQLGKVCKNTTPPRREWVGLTPDQVFAIADQHPVEGFDPDIMAFVRAIEAKLREKNA